MDGLGVGPGYFTIEIDTLGECLGLIVRKRPKPYLFNGEQLTPVTHQGQLQPRTAGFFIPGWKPTFCVSFAMATTRITTGGKFGIMMDPDSLWWPDGGAALV